MTSLDAHLVRYHGATTTALLAADGVLAADIRAALRHGQLVRVRRGAYVAPSNDVGVDRARAAAAVARSMPGYALSDQSAAWAYGLATWGAPPGRFHLIKVGAAPDYISADAVLHTQPDPELIQPLPEFPDVAAVTPALAAAQLAVRCGIESGLVTADDVLRRGLGGREDLEFAALSTGLTLHVKRAEAMAALASAASESVGESRTRFRLLQLGFQLREQVVIRDHGRFVARVDFLVGRTVVEFDGAVKYEGRDGRDALVAEKRREDELRRLGYRVVRLTWNDLDLGTLNSRMLPAVAAAA